LADDLCGKVVPPAKWALATFPKELAMSTLRELVKDRKVYSIDAARTVLEDRKSVV
jgi:hypothetical protein